MIRYSVLIIGAGKIGAFFDIPESESVLTHAHAFSTHPGFRLLGFVDADRQQAEQAAEIWGGEAFNAIRDAFARHVVDVAVVALPDECHYPVLRDLAMYPLKLVFAEKPLTTILEEAEEIIQLYNEKGISLSINYSRRHVPEFSALKEEIATGNFGCFLTGSGYYGKGTLHNGSHMVDMLRFLLGELSQVNTISTVTDFFIDDPSCSAVLGLDRGGQFFMQAVDCRCHTIFELDLLFESRRIRIVDSGFRIEKYSVRGSTVFSGYRDLQMDEECITSLGKALYFAAESLHAHLTSGEPVLCSGNDGLMAQQVCNAIMKSISA